MSERADEISTIVAALRDIADRIELGSLTVTDFDREIAYNNNLKRTRLVLCFERWMYS